MNALKKIQAELKAPKGQFNNFGKYNYRSAEDILEAVKPLLSKYDALLTLSDEVVEIGGRVYVKATAAITDNEGASLYITAYAREAEKKSGMDDSQITGTASSYARKYALNGLFLIDDTKDADTDAYTEQTKAAEKRTASKVSANKVKEINELIEATESNIGKMLVFFKVSKIEDMTADQAEKCIQMLEKKKK
jgi:hypothetical protein